MSTDSFEPIAIVAQSCLLPGALSPAALWTAVERGDDLLTSPPPGYWRMPSEHVLGRSGPDRTCTDRGGYVRGFASIFQPESFGVPAAEVLALDPIVQWVLHAAREALQASGIAGENHRRRSGLVLGNLSYPSASLSRLAEGEWLRLQGDQFLGGRSVEVAGILETAPMNRFMSGFPALYAARLLGLSEGGFAIDAACASSLYAIKLACDRLHDRKADLMLAGGVNRADNLFLHLGFAALGAVSRSGRSRPFHREADGLLPAEGAAFVALQRLDDALAEGRPILGIIRGIGLSNDGQGRGFLAPSVGGQVRAMKAAYEMAGLSPGEVSLVECHATGTAVGDSTEIHSMGEIFRDCGSIPIGSLKSNLGHLVTVAGLAGLMKVLGALRTGIRPPTRSAEAPIDALTDMPFRLLTVAEPWESRGPRIAAVSAFGFGGNNAHLIVQGPESARGLAVPRRPPAGHRMEPIAVVGIGACVADGRDVPDFARALFSGESRIRPHAYGFDGAYAEDVTLPRNALHFPPNDLPHVLPQQLLTLKATIEAVSRAGELSPERTGVLVGMQCDAEVARCGIRWRLADWAPLFAQGFPEADIQSWLGQARAAVEPPLTPAGVIGKMPNIPANRLNRQFDLRGPGFTVSAEEASGIVALDCALRALRANELDAAIVGAVDLCCEPVHIAAARAVLEPAKQIPGDAAVTLVLKRKADAVRDGNRIYGFIDTDPISAPDKSPRAPGLAEQFGHSHAASGLLHVAAALLACHHGASPRGKDRMAAPWLPAAEGGRSISIDVQSLCDDVRTARVSEPDRGRTGLLLEPLHQIHVYSGAHRGALLQAMAAGRESSDGPCKLAVVAGDRGELEERLALAGPQLESAPLGAVRLPEGIYFAEKPIEGELAFVYTMAAASYAGMGQRLFLCMPDLADRLRDRFRDPAAIGAWIYEDRKPTLIDQLRGYSLMCHAHTDLTTRILGLNPTAAIGLCTGESSALFSLGAWSDPDRMFDEIEETGLFTHELAGDFASVRRAWKLAASDRVDWATWRIFQPIERVRDALAREERVHLAIVHTPHDCMIVGQAAACERVISALGYQNAKRIEGGIAIHCPEVVPFTKTWRAIHRRKTRVTPGLRFYSHYLGASYPSLTEEAAANAITGQALQTIEFPCVIEQAWRDGVRVFVEHGPRGLCTDWIRQILGDREHVAVNLDASEQSPVRQVVNAAAKLMAAGVPLQHAELSERLRDAHGATRAFAEPAGTAVRVPAHPGPIHFPVFDLKVASAMNPLSAGSQTSAALNHALPDRFFDLQHRHSELQKQWIAGQAAAQQAFLAHSQNVAELLVELPYVLPANVPTELTLPKSLPQFSREQLEILASGKISSVFGPLFAQLDDYPRQVRMPMPPLLLADRVLGIDAEPGSMGTGTIWTETDVGEDSWYLHRGYMTPGIMIEAGQADLLLISWLGIDLRNRGQRVYRLLGCELTYQGSLPRPGDTLHYEIHIDGHARHEEIALFFFHYDCTVNGEARLSVRQGQAGFFSDQDLANSKGVLWDAETAEYDLDARSARPVIVPTYSAYSAEQIRAFSEGKIYECFGPGFEIAQTQCDAPSIPTGRMLLFDVVTKLDPNGGPWGRGYLQARLELTPDHWFFEGHFLNDPCMPGTLMFDGCLQLMAFYLSALGYSVNKDGWRFEPVKDETFKLQCRGQVTPRSRELVYELFVEEVRDGPMPILYADLLCTVDGLKAFHCRRMAYQLVPSWPMENNSRLLGAYEEPKPVAVVDGFSFGYKSLLAAAWGKASDAFGARYAVFDGHRKVSRLPGPPYHFMTRILNVEGECALKAGMRVTMEYDIPPGGWYFTENGNPTMPFCVLLEAALQPCGWISTYIGCPLEASEDLKFRNLDGTGTLHEEVFPDDGTLTTTVLLTNVSRSGNMFIFSFEVDCHIAERRIYSMKTVFGYFPYSAFENQAGLPKPAMIDQLGDPSELYLDLNQKPARYFGGPLRLPGDMLRVIDRVVGYWPNGGSAGLGFLRAEKDVDPSLWFFKSHFFQDPVQPGSLGLEAMLQLLQVYLLHQGMDAGVPNPRFQPLALGQPLTWKYRGQVVPTAKLIVSEIEIQKVGRNEQGPYVIAKAWLSVDGLRIYEALNMGMSIVAGAGSIGTTKDSEVDVQRQPWLRDHCPTYNVPALAMMDIADHLAEAALAAMPQRRVLGLRDVQVNQWIVVDKPCRLQSRSTLLPDGMIDVSLAVWREDEHQFDEAASGRVRMGENYAAAPRPFPSLPRAVRVEDPYREMLFHGPAFQVVRELSIGPDGFSALLDAGAGSVPRGLLHPALLDGLFHGPYAELQWWNLPADRIAYPIRISSIDFYGPTPTQGEVRCEVRLVDTQAHPKVHAQLLVGDCVWADASIVLALFPKGRIGLHSGPVRRAFLKDGRAVKGVGLSSFEEKATRLSVGDVKSADWFPGVLASAYALSPAEVGNSLLSIAIKDHVGQRAGVHPSTITIAPDLRSAECASMPFNCYPVRAGRVGDEVVVCDDGDPFLDTVKVFDFWRGLFERRIPAFEEMFHALYRQFLYRVVIPAPAAFSALRGRPRLYLCNHQVQIESILVTLIAGALGGTPIVTIANAKHETRWIGQLLELMAVYPQTRDTRWIRYFDPASPESLPGILEDYTQTAAQENRSLLVHVEGTRTRSCRSGVQRMSALLLDLALKEDLPIVPVRFVGGLPVQPVNHKLEFPVGYTGQDYYFGAPILPEMLRSLPLIERKRMVMNAINNLGPPNAEEQPNPPMPSFAADVEALRETWQMDEVHGVMSRLLQDCPNLRETTNGTYRFGSDAEGVWLRRFVGWITGEGAHPRRSVA